MNIYTATSLYTSKIGEQFSFDIKDEVIEKIIITYKDLKPIIIKL